MSAQPDLSKLSVGQFAERFRSEMIPLSNTFSYFCASVPLTEEDLKEYLEEPIAALPPAIAALLSMSAQPDLSKLSVGQFAERFRSEMIPLSNTFSYFCASVPLSEEDVKEYLEEPIAALPPSISALLPKVSIMLVPYLERGEGKEKGTSAPRRFRLHRKAARQPRSPGPPRSASTKKKCWSSRSRIRTFRNITIASITSWRRWPPIMGPKKRRRSTVALLREELNARDARRSGRRELAHEAGAAAPRYEPPQGDRKRFAITSGSRSSTR